MVFFIIYLAMVAVITAISVVAKGDDRFLFAFDNHKLQRLVRLLFVISAIFVLFNPFPVITNDLAPDANAESVLFARITQFALNLFAGVFASILTWCAIKIIKWIWK